MIKKKKKIKRINNAGLFSEPSLIIFTKGANNSDHDCVYIYIYIYIYVYVYIYMYVCCQSIKKQKLINHTLFCN